MTEAWGIPPPETILKWRIDRSKREVHPVDEGVTLDQIEKQVAVFREAAIHFKRSEMLMYVRDDFEGMPKDVVVPEPTG